MYALVCYFTVLVDLLVKIVHIIKRLYAAKEKKLNCKGKAVDIEQYIIEAE